MHGTALLCEPLRQEECRPGQLEPLEALLAPYLQAWQRHGVRFGTRWWDGRSLEQYAALFSTVVLEVDSRTIPSPSLLGRLRQGMAGDGWLTVIVRDDVLHYRFPHGHPDRRCRGERNTCFLDPGVLEERVLEPLEVLRDAPGVVVLDIPRIYPTEGPVFGQVLSRLDRLLSELPRTQHFAVALHNGSYLLPDYLACLRHHGVSHVLCCEADMPPLLEQLQMPDMLHRGPVVVEAPPERMDEDVLVGIAAVVGHALEEAWPLVVCAGDRPQDSTLAGLLALMTFLNPELAKRSIVRRSAA